MHDSHSPKTAAPTVAAKPIVMLVAGARPNFMKVAPVHRAIRQSGRLRPYLVHTGQHHDPEMSDVFFRDLDLPQPDAHLGISGGSHAELTARVMVAIDGMIEEVDPALVAVVGDVNSTLAASLVAAKRCIPLAHIEAGLRSRDRAMPEEINRVLTDRISDLLFVTEDAALENLAAEGVPPDQVHMVGNVMIDTLFSCRERIEERPVSAPLKQWADRPFALATLHRPSNVDHRENLGEILGALEEVAANLPIILPLHPRTRRSLERFGWSDRISPDGPVHMIDPLGYLDFMYLMFRARLVLTDSGGIQEETTAIGTPCLTLRENTERPITITHGTNQLVGGSGPRIVAAAKAALATPPSEAAVPPLWDGHAAERITEALEEFLLANS